MNNKMKPDLFEPSKSRSGLAGNTFLSLMMSQSSRTKAESLNKKTPIIMLSGFIDDELRKNLGIQNVQFIAKPFQSNEIFDKVRDHLI